jgi:hypothetical protein
MLGCGGSLPALAAVDACVSLPSGSACDDGNVCTVDDVCQGGVCVGGPARNCDDRVDCTVDGCNASGCYHTPDVSRCPPDLPWDCKYQVCYPWGCAEEDLDGGTWPCRTVHCGQGRCYGGACAEFVACIALNCESCDPVTLECSRDDCNDGNSCTVDYCVYGAGFCEHSSAHCADADPCTTDFCDESGQCAHVVTVCNDYNPCTDDVCAAGSGCVFTPDDGNVCNGSDADPCTVPVCASGTCVEVAGTAAEIFGIRFPSKSTLAWNFAPSGTGLQYQVLRGGVASLPVGSPSSGEVCAPTTLNSIAIAALPDLGAVHWYLVRAGYLACSGSYGHEGLHGAPASARVSATCP